MSDESRPGCYTAVLSPEDFSWFRYKVCYNLGLIAFSFAIMFLPMATFGLLTEPFVAKPGDEPVWKTVAGFTLLISCMMFLGGFVLTPSAKSVLADHPKELHLSAKSLTCVYGCDKMRFPLKKLKWLSARPWMFLFGNFLYYGMLKPGILFWGEKDGQLVTFYMPVEPEKLGEVEVALTNSPARKGSKPLIRTILSFTFPSAMTAFFFLGGTLISFPVAAIAGIVGLLVGIIGALFVIPKA